MRAGFVGTQRYGILPWSGDVNRTWGGLRPQVELTLQMGLQGVAWMHSDLGGFAGDNRDPELYVRWMQYGVFQPIYRPHGHEDVPPEPIFWDDDTKESCARHPPALPGSCRITIRSCSRTPPPACRSCAR
jgi:oligosaccharide 4-alpha-D-glucosyltransferase